MKQPHDPSLQGYGRHLWDVEAEPTAEHSITDATHELGAARLENDERFWRTAIATWQTLLQAKPRHPETLRYLKSCQTKLAQVLVLLGRHEEAAKQNQAALATGRRLHSATRKTGSGSKKATTILVCLALLTALAVVLLFNKVSRQRAQTRGAQQGDALESRQEVLFSERQHVRAGTTAADGTTSPSGHITLD